MDEATLLTDPAHDETAWPQRELAQCGDKVAKYVMGCYNVASTCNHWLPTKGRVSNACIGGFGNHAMSFEVGMTS